MRFHLIPVKMAISRKRIATNAGENVRKEPSYTVHGNINESSHYGNQHGGSLQN
jgi:hypothetical protein